MLLFPCKKIPYAELLLLLVAIAWGTSYSVTKMSLVYTTVFCFLFIRFFMTSFILLPLFIYRHWQGKTGPWKKAIPSGVVLFAIFCAETYGVLHTTASNAAFLISICILLTPLVEWWWLKKAPAKSLFLFVAISLVGVLLLTEINLSEISLNQGDFYILIAALLRAVIVVMTKQVINSKSLSALEITTVQSSMVMLLSLTVVVVSGELDFLIVRDDTFWLNTLYLVIVCTLFAFFVQNYAIKRSSPSRVSLLMGSEPAFGALFAFIYLGETFSSWQLFGAVLVLTSTLCVAANIADKPLFIREKWLKQS